MDTRDTLATQHILHTTHIPTVTQSQYIINLSLFTINPNPLTTHQNPITQLSQDTRTPLQLPTTLPHLPHSTLHTQRTQLGIRMQNQGTAHMVRKFLYWQWHLKLRFITSLVAMVYYMVSCI